MAMFRGALTAKQEPIANFEGSELEIPGRILNSVPHSFWGAAL